MSGCDGKRAATVRSRLSAKKKREISELAKEGLTGAEISRRVGVSRVVVERHLRELEKELLSRLSREVRGTDEAARGLMECLIQAARQAVEQRTKALQRQRYTEQVFRGEQNEKEKEIRKFLKPEFEAANKSLEIEVRCLKEVIEFLKEAERKVDGERRFGVEKLSDEELEERLRILEGGLRSGAEAGEAEADGKEADVLVPGARDEGRARRGAD